LAKVVLYDLPLLLVLEGHVGDRKWGDASMAVAV
jgi:hypothetical protein